MGVMNYGPYICSTLINEDVKISIMQDVDQLLQRQTMLQNEAQAVVKELDLVHLLSSAAR